MSIEIACNLEILLTFVGLADISLHYDSFSLYIGNCLRLTTTFEFSSSLRDLEFRCGFYFFNYESWCSDNLRVNWRLISYLKLLCDFLWKVLESKFTWHFLFLQFNPSCFDHDVTPNMTYLLLLLEIQSFNAQS